MKRLLVILMLLVATVLPVGGCAVFGGDQNWQQNDLQLKANIFMLSKIATRIALAEARMPPKDAKLVRGYLVALQDLLAVPGYPNFVGARALVATELPRRYHVYGLTIIDVLERYLRTTTLNLTDDQELIIAIIVSGIDGAIAAVDEFAR